MYQVFVFDFFSFFFFVCFLFAIFGRLILMNLAHRSISTDNCERAKLLARKISFQCNFIAMNRSDCSNYNLMRLNSACKDHIADWSSTIDWSPMNQQVNQT